MQRLRAHPDAMAAIRSLAADPKRRQLWQAVMLVINLARSDPDDARARSRRYASSTGGVVWGVPVRLASEDVDWLVLWRLEGDEVVVLYVGEDPR